MSFLFLFFVPFAPKPGRKQRFKMPFDDDCVNKHRNSYEADCNACSDDQCHYTLSRMADIEPLADTIIKTILRKKAWEDCARKASFVIRYAVYEMCINAVEHGILNIGYDAKIRLKNETPGEYEDLIEAMWQAVGVPIMVSLCFNDEKVVLGVHDDGKGFDFNQDRFSRIPEDKILEQCGKGLAILRSFSVRLYWNEKGNSILCVYRRPCLKMSEG